MRCYENEAKMRSKIIDDIINEHYMSFNENMAVNELIKINTTAKKELENTNYSSALPFSSLHTQDKWYPYNIVFSKLSANLQKRINN